MGKAISAAKEVAKKHEAAVQELRNKAGDKADELLAEAEKLAASTTMTQTEAVYSIIQNMTDEANTQAAAGVSSSEAAEALAQLGKPEAPAPSVTLEELEGMDDTLWTQEETEGPRPAWRITDDGCADWACRKIAEEKAELDRIRELADAQIQKIEEKLAAAERRYENGTRFLTGKLAEYFETVPHKATKTKESYCLLSGTLTRKYGSRQMKQDDAQLVQYLKDSGQSEFIKTEEKPKWGEFKKRLEIMGGSVVDKETGEIVEAVQIVEKPDTFSVDV